MTTTTHCFTAFLASTVITSCFSRASALGAGRSRHAHRRVLDPSNAPVPAPRSALEQTLGVEPHNVDDIRRRRVSQFVNLAPAAMCSRRRSSGFQTTKRSVRLDVASAPALDLTLACRRRRRGGHGRRRRRAARHAVAPRSAASSARPKSPTCRWRSATGTTCCSRCPACRATATRNRPGPPIAGTHRRRQHPRQSIAAEQLPARRRGQQLDLDERPGAVDAGLAAVDRRDRRVQGGDQPVRRRIRPRAGRRDRRQHQVRHEPASAAPSTTTSATSSSMRDRSSRSGPNLDKPTNDQNQFGFNLGGPIVTEPRVLLRRLRGHAHHAGCAPHGTGA